MRFKRKHLVYKNKIYNTAIRKTDSSSLENKKLLICVSGGIDSIFLYHNILMLQSKYNFKIGLAHVNYNTSSESNNSMELCRELSKLNNHPFYLKVYDKVIHHVINRSFLPVKDIDVLVGSGVFTVGHFPVDSMLTCFNAVRHNGYFCFSATDKVLDTTFKNEYTYIKENSYLVDITNTQSIVYHASKINKYPARVYLFQKL